MRVKNAAVVLALGLASVSLAVAPEGRAAHTTPRSRGYVPVAVGSLEETTLHYMLSLPNATTWGPGPYPAVIDYSGYRPAHYIYDSLEHHFLGQGYAVIGLNIRGTGCSGGKFDYFETLQSRDGAEAIQWFYDNRATLGLDGRFGMVGKSYPGITQLFVAAEQPAALKAIVPGHVFGDLYRDVPFPGGIMNVTFAGGWSAGRLLEVAQFGPQFALGTWVEDGHYTPGSSPYSSGAVDQQCLRNQADHAPNPAINPFVQAMYNQFDGPFFWERSPWWWADKIKAPTFLVESWQDEQVGSRATHLIERFHPSLEWKFMASNGDHGEYYGAQMLPDIFRFLSFHLKEQAPVGDPCFNADFAAALACYNAEDPVIVNWENGANGGRNRAWRSTYSSWPPANQTAWRLNMFPDGSLTETAFPEPPALSESEALNARRAGAVDYAYTPFLGTQGVPRKLVGQQPDPGGTWNDKPPQGTYAQFQTAALTADKVLLGSASVDLYMTSTAPNTDLQVTLTEVRSDGREVYVQKGWLRASHRMEESSFSTELRPFQTHVVRDQAAVVPGLPIKARVEIFPFGHVFRAGSKLRFYVEAPNIKPELWGFAQLPIPAVNTIFTSKLYPSSIALPLLSGDRAGVAAYPACTLRNQPCRNA